MSWIRVATASECPAGSGIEVVAEEQLLALYNVDGVYYVLDGVCPHQGGPLAKGHVQGCIVTCPWHGWQFDLRNGQHQLNPKLHHPSYEVREVDGELFVKLTESTF